MSMVRFITSKLPILGTESAVRHVVRFVLLVGDTAEPAQHRPPRLRVQEGPGGVGVEQRRGAAPHPVQPFRRRPRFGVRRLVAAGRLTTAQADRDGQVGVDGRDRRHRQRVEDAAVGEQAAVENVRGDDAGYGDGCPDRFVHRAPLQPHRLAGDQVGGHRGIGDRQFFDGDLAEDVAHRVEDLRRPQHPGGGDLRIQQSQHGALRQRFCPLGEFVELSRRLQATH